VCVHRQWTGESFFCDVCRSERSDGAKCAQGPTRWSSALGAGDTGDGTQDANDMRSLAEKLKKGMGTWSDFDVPPAAVSQAGKQQRGKVTLKVPAATARPAAPTAASTAPGVCVCVCVCVCIHACMFVCVCTCVRGICHSICAGEPLHAPHSVK